MNEIYEWWFQKERKIFFDIGNNKDKEGSDVLFW